MRPPDFRRTLALVGAFLRQPRVVFEVIGGILLGPSAIGRDQGFLGRIFPASSLPYLALVADFGLVLYLFLIGLELDPQSLATHFSRAGAVAISGMVVPFCLGIAVSLTLFDSLMAGDPQYAHVSFVSFFVFIATAMSITAFPVLARILRETGLIYSRAGSLAMGAAAFNDAVAWCLLVLAISIANAGNMAIAGYVFLCILGFALVLFFLFRPIYCHIVRLVESSDSAAAKSNLFAFTIIVMLLCAWTTDLLGVDSIFGAFMFGLIVPRDSHIYHVCEEKLGEFVTTVFLPLYFALSGLKTDVTQISTAQEGAMVVLVCAVGTAGKVIGAGAPALMSGVPLRESAVVAVLMNTRGLVELIVLNLGLTSGVMNEKVFTVMVLMAIFTTFTTVPVVNYIYPPHLRVPEEAARKFSTVEAAEQLESPVRYVPSPEEALSLKRYEKLTLSLLVDKIEQLPGLMSLLFILAPTSEDSRLDVCAIRMVEPSFDDKDRFLQATDNGRVIEVEQEPTSMVSEEPGQPKPELISLSLFCRAIGASIDVKRLLGDTNEFPAEVQRLSEEHSSDLVFLPWRGGQYNEMICWSCLFRLRIPLVLVLEPDLDLSETKQQTPRGVRNVIVLITFTVTDVHLLQIALRLLESPVVTITVVVPRDMDSLASQELNYLLNELIERRHPQLAINILGFDRNSLDGYFRECSTNVYDLIMVSYVEPTADELLHHRSLRSLSRERTRTGTLSAFVTEAFTPSGPDLYSFRRALGVSERILSCDVQHPELGKLSERLYKARLASYIMVMHPPREPALARGMSVISEEEFYSPKSDLHNQIQSSAFDVSTLELPESLTRRLHGEPPQRVRAQTANDEESSREV